MKAMTQDESLVKIQLRRTDRVQNQTFNNRKFNMRPLRLIRFLRPGVLLGVIAVVLGAGTTPAQADQSVLVEWNANPATTDPGSNTVGYRVYHRWSLGNALEKIDVGNSTTASFGHLAPGQTHYFSVTAYNAAGVESPPTSEVGVTPALSDLVLPVAQVLPPEQTPTPQPTPSPQPTPAGRWSLFTLDDAPSDTQGAWTHSVPVELGVKFQPAVAGAITAIRFYKVPVNTSPHLGHLWNGSGTLLASVIFTGETESGWQEASLSQPVRLSPGATYIASCNTIVFSQDQFYFDAPLTRGPLRAPASWQIGGNGVYDYGIDVCPSRTYESSNYWVDVAFQETGHSPMSPRLDASAFGDQSQPSAAVTSSQFSTSENNELFLALVATDYLSGPNTMVTGVTGAGLKWELVQRTNTQSGTAEIWRAFAVQPMSQVNVTATLSQSVVASITVMSFGGVDTSGANGSGAIGATASGNASGGAPTASLTTTQNGSLVVGVGNDYDNPISRTAGSGQRVVRQDLTPTGDTYWVQMQNSPTLVSGTQVTINDVAPTADRYNLSICEVLASRQDGPSAPLTDN